VSGIWTLVPVKSLDRGKSRLSTRLTPSERQSLSQAMLRDVLTAVSDAPSLMGGVVICADPTIRTLAEELGARAIAEAAGVDDLNSALRQGLDHLANIGAEAALILPADVPLVDAAALEQLIAGSSRAPGITICPSLDGGGTNALLLRPLTAISLSYGPGSYQKHVQEARSAGLSVSVNQHPSLALDIDEPRDLDRFLSVDSSTHARTMLRGLPSS
jgi:2-phospho-L-lactate guanylyltransferase